jgi:hypothetical protein
LSSFGQSNEKHFGFEFSAGPSWATTELGGADLSPGLGFEGTLHYRFLPHLGLYAGWGWNRFVAKESFAGDNARFEETGYVLGLQFKHPIGNTPISYYLRGAGLYNHIETEDAGGEIVDDTGHGYGWQAAAGIELRLGSGWSLTPGVKFHSLSRDTDFDGVSRELKLNYVSARLGILKKF